MHSIRIRITVITIVAIITTILCVFAASFATLRAENNRNSVEKMSLIGQDTKKSIEKYTESIEHAIEMITNIASDSLDRVILAENGAIGSNERPAERDPEQKARLDTYLTGYCAGIQEIFTGIASHTHGIISYYFCINPKISGTVHGFFFSRVGKTGFEEKEPLDAARLDPDDTAHNTWYYTSIQRGRPSWIGPYTAQSLGELWICSYTVPLYRSGTLIGVIGMDIPVDILIDQVDSIRVYDTGFASLLEENRVLYHPEREFGSVLEASDLPFSEELYRQDKSGDELIRYTKNGEERQLSFCTLTNGMKLVIVAPTREINAAWLRLVNNNLLITMAIIIAFVVIIMLVMRAITRPLLLLTAASQRLADADYDVDLNYQRRDEVGTLTIAFKKMRDQIRQYIDDLNRQLLTDKLTGLPNVRHFFRLAAAERERLLEQGKQPAMLYFDILGMKHYNRQFGFEAGDRLICEFAGFLSRHFGRQNVCRYSGDHFAAVAEEQGLEESLEEFFRECQSADSGKPILVKAGIYPYRLEDVDVNVACDRAKHACDQNKSLLASGYSWFDNNMLKQGELYRYIYNNLDRALSEGWIKVYYQPIIRAADGKVCDEEALSRWIDPVMGFISPADFIYVLEDCRLIYRLDLYVLEQVLEKMKQQAEAGYYVVPQSVNLSRSDFDACDIVEEIRKRVDDAGMDRSLITIEITESVIGSDFDFMKKQVDRFRSLGFPVWMDDFGSGYSSLDVLQQIHFDLIKFDMKFMEHFDEGDESKIILTELMKMAFGLGMETVCEGVEQENQVDFLREIGCTRIQGYYYGKPLPFEGILTLLEKGLPLEFENPAESEYYAVTGRINLYDMAVLLDDNDENLRHYFNTLPMSILEVNGNKVKYYRCNKSYRDFLQRTLGVDLRIEEMDYLAMPEGIGIAFMNAVVQCSRGGKRVLVDERVNEDTTIHAFVRRVAVNPVSGTVAVAAAVLAVVKEGENAGTNYAQIAKALSADYVNLYYVNLNTGKFTEYNPDAARENLTLERHGEYFFTISREEAKQKIYKDDQEYFISAFHRENIEKNLDEQGAFTLTYRLLIEGKPTYVTMKAVRMPGDRSHIIIGVSNVDAQMRQKEVLARIQAERATYSRVSALTQDYICIYTVDPETNQYTEYIATEDYAELSLPKEGDDLFAQSRIESVRYIYPEDLRKFQTLFTRENILGEIQKNGICAFRYRMLLDGEPTYVGLKAALVEENDGPQLIIGINNVDAQVTREMEYELQLSEARSKANLDILTGVKNKNAYEQMSESLSRQIEWGQSVRYAIVLCQVKNLALVNESKGREAGDQLIREASTLVCETFKHSPVFRVTGDQFAVIAQGYDFDYVDVLLKSLRATILREELPVSCGMAKYDETEGVSAVFARAEGICRGENNIDDTIGCAQ
ncbi:MAG: EAL domain-containing protein [Blautia sp.]|nr:EAL domain-containing protein [Blautia sp.]